MAVVPSVQCNANFSPSHSVAGTITMGGFSVFVC